MGVVLFEDEQCHMWCIVHAYAYACVFMGLFDDELRTNKCVGTVRVCAYVLMILWNFESP